MAAPLTLRGHHLLCTLNYSGGGYSPAFIANFDDLCVRLNQGEAVRLTWRPDSICQPMLGQPECHCYQKSIHWRDFFGFLATSVVLRQWVFPPKKLVLTPTMVARLRGAFATNLTRAACVGCQWFSHCSKTAGNNWPSSKLMPAAKPSKAGPRLPNP